MDSYQMWQSNSLYFSHLSRMQRMQTELSQKRKKTPNRVKEQKNTSPLKQSPKNYTPLPLVSKKERILLASTTQKIPFKEKQKVLENYILGRRILSTSAVLSSTKMKKDFQFHTRVSSCMSKSRKIAKNYDQERSKHYKNYCNNQETVFGKGKTHLRFVIHNLNLFDKCCEISQLTGKTPTQPQLSFDKHGNLSNGGKRLRKTISLKKNLQNQTKIQSQIILNNKKISMNTKSERNQLRNHNKYQFQRSKSSSNHQKLYSMQGLTSNLLRKQKYQFNTSLQNEQSNCEEQFSLSVGNCQIFKEKLVGCSIHLHTNYRPPLKMHLNLYRANQKKKLCWVSLTQLKKNIKALHQNQDTQQIDSQDQQDQDNAFHKVSEQNKKQEVYFENDLKPASPQIIQEDKSQKPVKDKHNLTVVEQIMRNTKPNSQMKRQLLLAYGSNNRIVGTLQISYIISRSICC